MTTMNRRTGRFGILVIICSILLFIPGCKETPEKIYKKAMESYQAEKYQKAVQLYELILTEYPEHSLTWKARYQLGNIFFYKLNQPEKALKYLQELYAQVPPGKNAMKALQLIGYIYDKSLNRCLEGVEAYRKLIQDYSSEIEAENYQFAIAECYFRLHNYEQAITEYEMLVKDYPDSQNVARARFQIANSYTLIPEYDKAIEEYTMLLQLNPLPEQLAADIKVELAYCYTQKEQFEDALSLYDELLEVDLQNVSIDKDLIQRKKEFILERIKKDSRKPSKVKW